jgi:4-hydroxythreonine-4-phosphate dehydrogenase
MALSPILPINNLKRIAITSGEPAGIGPDICVMLAQQGINANLTFIGDADVILARAKQLNLPFDASRILHVPISTSVTAGKLNPHNSQYVLNLITNAIDGCLSHQFDAMVNAPVHKGIINDAGITFSGHTEFIAEFTNTSQVVMMLVGGQQSKPLRVALATTHLALRDVPDAINKQNLEATIRILQNDLTKKFGLANPHILIAGLNPHAGEGGHLGMEEIEIINPVLNKLRLEGMWLTGALPADTLFTDKYLAKADAVLAMYHDQGLPVLKHLSFGTGVNVTLGLPIIRTSVDHGTALDLAGTGCIDIGSMKAAIDLAIELSSQ